MLRLRGYQLRSFRSLAHRGWPSADVDTALPREPSRALVAFLSSCSGLCGPQQTGFRRRMSSYASWQNPFSSTFFSFPVSYASRHGTTYSSAPSEASKIAASPPSDVSKNMASSPSEASKIAESPPSDVSKNMASSPSEAPKSAASAPSDVSKYRASSPSEAPKKSASPSSDVSKSTVSVSFEFQDGSRKTVDAKIGSNLLDVVLDRDVDIDGFGACEGTLACSTCHLILSKRIFATMSMEVSDEEMDMLDLAFGLEETSRLGCQCVVSKNYDGETFKVPLGTNDMRAD